MGEHTDNPNEDTELASNRLRVGNTHSSNAEGVQLDDIKTPPPSGPWDRMGVVQPYSMAHLLPEGFPERLTLEKGSNN